MKLIVFLLSCILTYPQSNVAAWSFLRGQIQDSHVLPMLIYFSSDHCLECEKFDALFEQPEMLQQMEQHYVSVRVSIDDSSGKACADIYRIETVPAFVIADQKGVILYKSDESLSVEDVQLLLDHVPATYSTVHQPGEMVAGDGESLDAISTPDTHESSTTAISSVEVDLQKVEPIPVIHTEESKPVQVLPVATTEEKSAVADEHKPVANLSPALNASAVKPEISETSNNTNLKPAVSNSTPSKVEVVKPVVAKSTVRVQRNYSIQLGYFTEAVNSKKLEQRAKAKGLTETRTQIESREGKSFYRVLIGDFKTLAAAQAQLAEVHALGLKGAVHRQ